MPSCWMTTSIRKNTLRSWARRSNFAAVPASKLSTRPLLTTSRQSLLLPKSFPHLKRRNLAWTKLNCSINVFAPFTMIGLSIPNPNPLSTMERPSTSGHPVHSADGRRTQKSISKKQWTKEYSPSSSLKYLFVTLLKPCRSIPAGFFYDSLETKAKRTPFWHSTRTSSATH